jgi:ABC-type amino acid transport system permease subunit
MGSKLANGYVELFRNIPLLVQMFLWYFVMPELVPTEMGNWLKSMPNAPFITAVLSLVSLLRHVLRYRCQPVSTRCHAASVWQVRL